MSLLVVKEPFAVARKDGRLVSFRKGDLVDSSDPVAKSHRAFFEQARATVWSVDAPVESATAAPGEKRSVKLPPKKAAE